ncbi:MAG: MgtC/SapB family protein [Armatimonadota bacterium]
MNGILLSLPLWGTILGQLLIATVLGGMVGYQREIQDRPAGFRTHVLVCVGSAVYMLVSIAVAGDQYDPGRIAAQVASGMGFLGAGTIIKQGNIVRGLTTAASLWAVAAIGMAVGYGGKAMIIALLGTLVVLGALTVLKVVERRIDHGFPCNISLSMHNPRERLDWMRETLTAHGLELHGLELIDQPGEGGQAILYVRAVDREHLELAISSLAQGKDITRVQWECR